MEKRDKVKEYFKNRESKAHRNPGRGWPTQDACSAKPSGRVA